MYIYIEIQSQQQPLDIEGYCYFSCLSFSVLIMVRIFFNVLLHFMECLYWPIVYSLLCSVYGDNRQYYWFQMLLKLTADSANKKNMMHCNQVFLFPSLWCLCLCLKRILSCTLYFFLLYMMGLFSPFHTFNQLLPT